MRANWFCLCILLTTPLGMAACSTASSGNVRESPTMQSAEIISSRVLENLDADTGARIARELFGLTAAVDPRMNILILKAPPNDLADALQLLDKLDKTSPYFESSHVVFVRRLHNSNAAEVVVTLDALVKAEVSHEEGSGSPVWPAEFVADDRTNSVVVSVDKGFETEVQRILDDLDRSIEAK